MGMRVPASARRVDGVAIWPTVARSALPPVGLFTKGARSRKA